MATHPATAPDRSLQPQFHGSSNSGSAADGSLPPKSYGYSNSALSTYPTALPTWHTSPSLYASPTAPIGPPPFTPASRHDFDTTGQVAPPGMKPIVTATLWADEGTLCFQVEARGICVARREDNHMINGTKLLNVAGMTRGRRDGILKSEKIRHLVKIGPMQLKGVWIPFDRALAFANQEKITELLYPLFAQNIGAFLDHPDNHKLEPPKYPTPYSQFSAVAALNTPPTSASSVMSECASLADALIHSTHPSQRRRFHHSPPLSPPWDADAADTEPLSLRKASPTALDTAAQILPPIPFRGSKQETFPSLHFAPEASPAPPPDQRSESETGTISSNTASDYTSSSGEDETLLTLVDQKRALLNRLMRFFYLIIATSPSPTWHARNRGSGQTQTTSSATTNRSTTQGTHDISSISSSSKRTAQKRHKGDGDDDSGENEDRNNKRLRRSGSSTQVDSASQRLACPFFKHNQGRYRMWRACPGPGWATVHRIKEHVYRRHALPVRCPRCNQIFETERQKDDHISQEERCAQVEDTSPPEGIDADKKKLLQSRKGKNKEASEVDKWNEMYLIIFPEADSANLPSPYYDYSTESSAPGSPGGEFVRYEQFLRRELPGRVRQELETRIEERLNPVEETLRGELVEIVRDMQLQLFELYKASRNSAPEPEPEPEIVPFKRAPSPQQQQAAIQSASGAAPDMGSLEAFSQPPFINSEDWVSFDDFDGQVWDPSMLDSHAMTLWGGDSGYGSLPTDLTRDEQFTECCEKERDPEL